MTEEFLTPGGLRARSPEETLTLILPRLQEFDIVRVVDVTPLDRIGIPVCSSIRPRSRSLCLNNGKGLTITQAKVGAIMESIEFAVAERCPADTLVLGTSIWYSLGPLISNSGTRLGRQQLKKGGSSSTMRTTADDCVRIAAGFDNSRFENCSFIPITALHHSTSACDALGDIAIASGGQIYKRQDWFRPTGHLPHQYKSALMQKCRE